MTILCAVGLGLMRVLNCVFKIYCITFSRDNFSQEVRKLISNGSFLWIKRKQFGSMSEHEYADGSSLYTIKKLQKRTKFVNKLNIKWPKICKIMDWLLNNESFQYFISYLPFNNRFVEKFSCIFLNIAIFSQYT